MSAIYQGELLELTPQDLQVLEQELNPNDEFQQLDLVTAFEPLDSNASIGFQSLEENWMDELEDRWESDYSPRPLTEQEEEEWLQYEQERMESAIEETQNEW